MNVTAARTSRHGPTRGGFTLMELLVVVAIIALLTSILLPSLTAAREQARSVKCLSNLHGLGLAMSVYHTDNDGRFWRCTMPDSPVAGVVTYFWGTNTDPVDFSASPLLEWCDDDPASLWCPSLPWGSYVPQGHVSEPTTTYGYNSWYLDPASYVWDFSLPPKRASEVTGAGELFVFNDAGTVDTWAGGGVFKNSTHLEPVTGTFVQTPTTHFRHGGKTNALCADGHAATYGLEGGQILDDEHMLGFVGTDNDPHYARD